MNGVVPRPNDENVDGCVGTPKEEPNDDEEDEDDEDAAAPKLNVFPVDACACDGFANVDPKEDAPNRDNDVVDAVDAKLDKLVLLVLFVPDVEDEEEDDEDVAAGTLN